MPGTSRGTIREGIRRLVGGKWAWLRTAAASACPGLVAPMLAMLILPSLAEAAGTVNFLFYGRDGVLMSPAMVRQTSNNGSAGYNNDFLIDPVTMQAVSEGVLINSANGLSFAVPDIPVALALNWPTDPLGYGLIVLDNGGGGFTSGGTVNFTYQAAWDVRRKLDQALAARPDYVASQRFQAAYGDAKSILAGITASSTESQKGSAGQMALDRLAVAFDALLTENGPVRAVKESANSTPWLGVTLADTANYKANIDLAAKITQPYGWVRIVFAYGTKPSAYTDVVNYAQSKGLKILGQPVDANDEADYTPAQYKQRFIDFVSAFPQIEAWEVGNEVNGGWHSTTMASRVTDAIAEVKSRAPGKLVVLTFFWQLNTNDLPFSMFSWIHNNVLPATRDKVDVVLVSLYPHQVPMGAFFDQMMNTLRAEFPTQKIGLGELGCWIKGERFWWCFSKTDPPATSLRSAADALYLEDAFPGKSASMAKLPGSPGFDSGNTVWTISPYSVLQTLKSP